MGAVSPQLRKRRRRLEQLGLNTSKASLAAVLYAGQSLKFVYALTYVTNVLNGSHTCCVIIQIDSYLLDFRQHHF
jgi:hypothetical protein